MTNELESVALTLVADGKGILAADETVHTLTQRFDTLGIQSTEKSRCTYREMLFTAGVAEFISGSGSASSVSTRTLLTVRPVSAGTEMRWRRRRSASPARRIAVHGTTTDRDDI